MKLMDGGVMLARRFAAHLQRKAGLGDYAAALALSAASVLVRLALVRIDDDLSPFLILFPTVILEAVFFGAGPALLASAAGWATTALLIVGPGLLVPPLTTQQSATLAFWPSCLTVIWAASLLRQVAAKASMAEARLAAVFRQIPGAAAIIEAPTGRLLLRSTQSNAVLGQPECPGVTVADLAGYGAIHPDGRPFAAADYPIARALRDGTLIQGDMLRYRRPDGTFADLEVYASPVRADDGRVVAAVGMAFDVSERANAQRQLQDSETRYRTLAERLGTALDEREVLMREADHRIKNSLQLVVSLLRLQIGQVHEPEAKDALNAAVARVEAVSEAHLALQRSPDLKQLDLAQILQDLCRRLGMLNPAVTISCDAAPGLLLDAEQALPLALVASELLTNAMRHAFPNGMVGTVLLSAGVSAGVLGMTVADDGVGMPEGTSSSGLGSTVVTALARQVGATLERSSVPGQGMTVKLVLPVRDL